jgi:hypothetical protein
MNPGACILDAFGHRSWIGFLLGWLPLTYLIDDTL